MKSINGNKSLFNLVLNECINKRFIFYTLLCMFVAQTITAPLNAQQGSTASQKKADSIVEARLVELALKGPLYTGAEHQNKINEYELKAAKNSWLNLLTISANYNDQTFAKTNAQNAYVYPKFFTGINIPLGTIFSRTGVKAAKEGVEISKINQEQLQRNIRAEVLSKYKQYKTYQEYIVLQKSVADDYQAAFLQIEANASETPIEKYNLASKNFSEEQTKLLNLQLQRDLIKIDIEKMIGVDLDTLIAELNNTK